MLRVIILIMSINFSWANNISMTHEAKLNSKKNLSYNDFAHEFKGCPENSICAESVGQKFIHWHSFLEKIKNFSKQQKFLALKNYHKKHGIPLTFLLDFNRSRQFKAAYWNSRCLNHNKKNGTVILKGINFFKNPINDLKFDELIIVTNKNIPYKLPYEFQPILIKNKKIIFTVDYDDIYFYMSSSIEGKWKVENIHNKLISKAINYNQSVTCNKQYLVKDQWHSLQVCKKIWNEDIKKTQLIVYKRSCP